MPGSPHNSRVSSLPPYNRVPAGRRVFLLASETEAAALQTLLDSLPESVSVTRDPAGLGDGDVALVAPAAACEELLREMLGAPPDGARLEILPGALSEVQVLPDRVVVRHLNLGKAIS